MLLAAARAPRVPDPTHTLAGANRSCIPLEFAPSALVSPAAWCGYPARSLPSRDSPDAYCPFGELGDTATTIGDYIRSYPKTLRSRSRRAVRFPLASSLSTNRSSLDLGDRRKLQDSPEIPVQDGL